MRRIFQGILSLILIFASTQNATAATPKTGTSCSKIGSVQESKGVKYTCIKAGKKLVWIKGVKVVPTTPTPTPSPTPTQSSNQPENRLLGPNSFADLFEYRMNISQLAFEKLKNSNRTISPIANFPSIEVIKGPNSIPYSTLSVDEILKSLLIALPGTPSPRKFIVIYYSRQDLEWGKNRLLGIMGSELFQKAHSGNLIKCNLPDDCDDGDAYVAPDSTAYIAIGLKSKLEPYEVARKRNGQVEAVELYHALQEYSYIKNGSLIDNVGTTQPINKPPYWLNIGGEEFAHKLISSSTISFKTYKEEIASNLQWMRQLNPVFDQVWLDDYLNIKNLDNLWRSNKFGLSSNYANIIGVRTLEIFVSLKGPSVLLEFHRLMSEGLTFEQSFKSIFDASYQEAYPEISRVIYDEFTFKY